MSVTTEGRNIIIAPEGEHKHTVIWLHGLGDSADGFLPVFKGSKIFGTNTKIVLLTAPIRAVTVNGGMKMNSWFDFRNVEVNETNYQ
jgi:phospholipase/carboxylesterase